MKILVTGAAGFIGFHTCKRLLDKGHHVVGLDNINDYYAPQLKYDRLKQLGIPQNDAEKFGSLIQSEEYPNFHFIKIALENASELEQLFKEHGFTIVCNLAAQAGVRYSIENPKAYIESNVVGFLNLLENCRHHKVQHLVYASSSSVYGLSKKVPFETTDRVDNPISLYAATKKSNELMAHTYSHLYGFATTGLRFFTVYGPWGRPDMAYFLFSDAIANDRPIKVFNNGEMERDFTYIDDIVEGVVRVLEKPVQKDTENALCRIYNIGNNKSVKLIDFIDAIEKAYGKKAEKNMMPMQPGDVYRTWANVDDLIRDYGYSPYTPIQKGIDQFVAWYKSYRTNL